MLHKEFGSVCAGSVGVSVAMPLAGSRARPRIELKVYGARYPYKLAAEDARALAEALLKAADELEDVTLRALVP